MWQVNFELKRGSLWPKHALIILITLIWKRKIMKRTLIVSALLLASASPGLAETCQEKFANLLINGNGEGPVKIHLIQDIKGSKPSTNDFFMVSNGHWMTKMIEPASGWVLGYNNTMFQSVNEGKTWKKVRDFDSEKNHNNTIKDLEENSKTARNAACGEAEIDGVMHDIVEADYDTFQNFKSENHHKYWVNRKTGFISKATYNIKGKGFESFTTQTSQKAPA
jgi:hypothetical protein